ncbi:CC-NBS-LRR resistance protein [Tanacetum coccineum]
MKKNSCKLQVLSDNEGWFMFKEIANPLPELEEIGRDVVKKCVGLPLLLRVIGSMLQNNSDKDKWLSVPRKAWRLHSVIGTRNIDMEDVGKMKFSNLGTCKKNSAHAVLKQFVTQCIISKISMFAILKVGSQRESNQGRLKLEEESLQDRNSLEKTSADGRGRKDKDYIGRLSGMKSLGKMDKMHKELLNDESPVLEILSIENCPKIILLYEHYPHPLVILVIKKCTNLESIRSLQGLTSLQILKIKYCDSLSGIHDLGGSLREVRISDCPSLLGIPDLHNLGGSLRELRIENCDKMTSVPSGIDRLTLLDRLELGPFSKEVDCFPSLKGIEKLRSNLQNLHLYGRSHWESIPEEVKHLTSLERLVIWEFGIRELPMWLTNMSSIKRISFHRCPGLDADSVLKGAPRKAEIVFLDDKWLRRISIES